MRRAGARARPRGCSWKTRAADPTRHLPPPHGFHRVHRPGPPARPLAAGDRPPATTRRPGRPTRGERGEGARRAKIDRGSASERRSPRCEQHVSRDRRAAPKDGAPKRASETGARQTPRPQRATRREHPTPSPTVPPTVPRPLAAGCRRCPFPRPRAAFSEPLCEREERGERDARAPETRSRREESSGSC